MYLPGELPVGYPVKLENGPMYLSLSPSDIEVISASLKIFEAATVWPSAQCDQVSQLSSCP
jgi:hypothetical protein